jgi:hypothetical protein
MKKVTLILSLAIIAIAQQGCDLLQQTTSGLSSDEIVSGLKTALQVGTDSSVVITSKTDGFYKDALIKIALPSEASSLLNSPVYGTLLTPFANKVTESMNRAAEAAAPQAKEIFVNAITSLSITDGLSILNGQNPAATLKSTAFDSTAATAYLKSTTRTQLVEAFSEPVNAKLSVDLGLGFSANEAWNTFVTAYNLYALGSGSAPISNVDLGTYVTGKAIDGLFVKVGDQERAIRRDPYKWTSQTVGSILQRVFGN